MSISFIVTLYLPVLWQVNVGRQQCSDLKAGTRRVLEFSCAGNQSLGPQLKMAVNRVSALRHVGVKVTNGAWC